VHQSVVFDAVQTCKMTWHFNANPYLLQLLVALSDLLHSVLGLLCNLIVHCLGLVVVPSQEVLVRLGNILKEVMLAPLLVIKDICSGLQMQTS